MTSDVLILASSSPRRRQLLDQVGVKHQVCPAPDAAEPTPRPDESPEQYALRAAFAKAKAVQDALKDPHAWILGADTVVADECQLMGKPTDEEDARRMLHQLSGHAHTVHTAFVILQGQEHIEYREAATSEVWFFPLTSEEIDCYIASGEPMDKAGAYGIQGKGALLIERIAGSYTNIVGLPIERVVHALQELKATHLL